MEETQVNGTVADVVPPVRYAQQPGDPAWDAAFPLIIHYLYEHYGDLRIVQEHYDGVKVR
jgi:hypothetical protein